VTVAVAVAAEPAAEAAQQEDDEDDDEYESDRHDLSPVAAPNASILLYRGTRTSGLPEGADFHAKVWKTTVSSFITTTSLLIVFHRNILARVIGHESSGYRADDGAGGDKNGDRLAGVISSEQRSRDNRRRPAGHDRRELIAKRGATVAQSRREGFRDERRLPTLQAEYAKASIFAPPPRASLRIPDRTA
jgi:hypothetical protein